MPTPRRLPWKSFVRRWSAAGSATDLVRQPRYGWHSSLWLSSCQHSFSSRAYSPPPGPTTKNRFDSPWKSSPNNGDDRNITRSLSRDEIRKSLRDIYYHVHQNRKGDGPPKALQLLERLLEEETRSWNRNLKYGVVFNVLKSCQQQQQRHEGSIEKDDAAFLSRLERVLDLLEQNKHLWDVKWPSLILGAMARCSCEDAPVRAEALLNDMQELYAVGEEEGAQPNLYDYAVVLNSYAKRGQASQALRLLERMEALYDAGDPGGNDGPNTISFSVVVDAFAKSRREERDAAERATALVNRMEEMDAAGRRNIRPNVITYSCLLKCYANEGMANEAEQLLHKIHDLHKAGHLKDGPNIISFGCVMDALSKSRESDAPQRAEAVLNWMRELHTAGYRNVKPNSFIYGALLRCYASRGMAQEAILLLRQMHDLHSAGEIKEGPNTYLYNIVINAVAKSGKPDTPERAEALLNLMQEMHTAGHPHIEPDSFTFRFLLNCYASAGMTQEAENLLQQMHDRHDAGHLRDGPNRILYNVVVNMLAKSKEQDASDRAEKLVKDMIQLHTKGYPDIYPDVITYTSLLNCYANEGMANKAEELLQKMHDLHRAGDLEYPPNIFSYSCVLSALAKSDEAGASYRAETIFAEARTLQAACGRPDTVVFTSLLKCYANDGRAADAEDLLLEMHDLHEAGELDNGPNRISCNVVIDSLARSGDQDAPDRARVILDRMLELHAAGNSNIQPNVVTYSSLLNCYANEGMASEAEELLQQMLDLHGSGDLKDRPNTISFNSVMNALAKSKDEDAPERAKALLTRMQEMHAAGNANVQPDESTKTCFLHCFKKEGRFDEGEKLFEVITTI